MRWSLSPAEARPALGLILLEAAASMVESARGSTSRADPRRPGLLLRPCPWADCTPCHAHDRLGFRLAPAARGLVFCQRPSDWHSEDRQDREPQQRFDARRYVSSRDARQRKESDEP